jgi:hypothetical protein
MHRANWQLQASTADFALHAANTFWQFAAK